VDLLHLPVLLRATRGVKYWAQRSLPLPPHLKLQLAGEFSVEQSDTSTHFLPVIQTVDFSRSPWYFAECLFIATLQQALTPCLPGADFSRSRDSACPPQSYHGSQFNTVESVKSMLNFTFLADCTVQTSETQCSSSNAGWNLEFGVGHEAICDKDADFSGSMSDYDNTVAGEPRVYMW